MREDYAYNLAPFLEARLNFKGKVRKGVRAFSPEIRVSGKVTRTYTREGERFAILRLERKQSGLVREFKVPFATLIRLRSRKQKKAPALSKLDAVLLVEKEGKVALSRYIWCKKLMHFVGGVPVCNRRRQVRKLFPDCTGCDLSPLVGKNEEEKKELREIVEHITIYNDPPPHPVKGKNVPADSWVSGGKRMVAEPSKAKKKAKRKSTKSTKKKTRKMKKTVDSSTLPGGTDVGKDVSVQEMILEEVKPKKKTRKKSLKSKTTKKRSSGKKKTKSVTSKSAKRVMRKLITGKTSVPKKSKKKPKRKVYKKI